MNWKKNIMVEFNILDHFKHSLWDSEDKRYIVEQGGAGSGKAVPLDTKVVTPDGYKLMKDISVGDVVSNAYGGASRVTNKWDNSSRRIYKIQFEDGRSVRCADNHRWAFCVDDGPITEGTTKELISQMNAGGKISLPLPEPVYFENCNLTVLPFLVGAIIGATPEEAEILLGTVKKSDWAKYNLVDKRGNIITNIPREYRRMSVENRIEFIMGIYASSGLFDVYSQKIVLEVRTQIVAKKIQNIIWSLGGICYLRRSTITMSYKLTIDFKENWIKEKILEYQILNNEITYIHKKPVQAIDITSIKRDGDEECQCISVDSNDCLFLIEDYIVTHNSAAICQRLSYLFLTRTDTIFAVVRSTMPALSRSVYLGDPSIVRTLRDWGIPIEKWLNKTEKKITNPHNNSEIYFIGLDDPEKIKSMNVNYIFIEEATEINADKWAQLNTRLRRYNLQGKNQMFLAYNPISYYNWVVQMFAVNPDPLIKEDSIVHFSNFTQNPYVSLEDVKGWLVRASQDENYYRTYIVGIPGQPLGVIYPKIKFTPRSIWPEEVWEQKPYYGIDWGFIDPMVLVECRDYDNKVYVMCKYYERKKNTKEFLQFMESIKVPKSSNIYYDSADAERGSLLLQAGYTGFKAKKNINAGISYTNGFEIIVDSMGPYGQFAMDEIKSYTWKTDPNDSSKFIEKPNDENNHFCDAMRYAIVTEHMYNRNFSSTTIDLDINDRLRKGGIYMPESVADCKKF